MSTPWSPNVRWSELLWKALLIKPEMISKWPLLLQAHNSRTARWSLRHLDWRIWINEESHLFIHFLNFFFFYFIGHICLKCYLQTSFAQEASPLMSITCSSLNHWGCFFDISNLVQQRSSIIELYSKLPYEGGPWYIFVPMGQMPRDPTDLLLFGPFTEFWKLK